MYTVLAAVLLLTTFSSSYTNTPPPPACDSSVSWGIGNKCFLLGWKNLPINNSTYPTTEQSFGTICIERVIDTMICLQWYTFLWGDMQIFKNNTLELEKSV